MEKDWIEEIHDKADSQKLAASLNINPTLAEILISRQIDTFALAKDYFRPSLSQLHDPFLMKDMDSAVNRLSDAVANTEKILVYGDYDVDGTTSVALVYQFIRQLTDQVEFYIPDRYAEGYGISKQGIEWAAAQDYSLIIALDCGIRAIDNAKLAKEYNIDLIICDHHLPGDELPDAHAILDPKQEDCLYPYKELSGCGVGFKLLHGFCLQNTIELTALYECLDLLAVSIASDIVPITGENRILAYYGLKKLNSSPSPGLKSLIDIAGLKGEIDVSGVVFYIGPRINAAGRLRHAKESVQLLIANSDYELENFSKELNTANSDRRNFDRSITAEALEDIEENYPQAKSTVLYNENWHKGVVGIVASRCIEHHYRPTIILTQSNGHASGSARSVNGFNIHDAIAQCSDHLLQFGGHFHAAGLTLELDQIDAFREKFEEIVASTIGEESLRPRLSVDQQVDFDFVNHKNHNILKQMAPFGPQNMQPVFVSENVICRNAPRLIKEEHLKLTLNQTSQDYAIEAIAFGAGDHYDRILAADKFRIAYTIEMNEFRGNKTLQLNIKDIKYYH